MYKSFICAAFCLSMCGITQAGNTASASIDLNGATYQYLQGAGSFDFANIYGYAGSRIVSYDYDGQNAKWEAEQYSGSDTSAAWYGNTTSASFSTTGLTTEASTGGLGPLQQGKFSIQPNSYANARVEFYLAPHSVIRFTAPYATSGGAVPNQVNGGDELAGGQVYIMVIDAAQVMTTSNAHDYSYGTSPDFIESGVLELVITNDFDFAQSYTFSASANAYAVTSVNEVPEPSSVPLLLLGIVGLLRVSARKSPTNVLR